MPSPNPNPVALPPQAASPMYRSASPQPQPMGVNPNQIAPDTLTYTTSYGPDGQIVYHPFRYVCQISYGSSIEVIDLRIRDSSAVPVKFVDPSISRFPAMLIPPIATRLPKVSLQVLNGFPRRLPLSCRQALNRLIR